MRVATGKVELQDFKVIITNAAGHTQSGNLRCSQSTIFIGSITAVKDLKHIRRASAGNQCKASANQGITAVIQYACDRINCLSSRFERIVLADITGFAANADNIVAGVGVD